MTALAEAGPARKDVVSAEIGAAAAFVGLVLVFLGVFITTYQTLLGTISQDRLAKFKTAGAIALFVAVLGLVSIVVSTAWLVADVGKGFYVVTLVVFFTELVALVGVALYSSWKVLFR